MKHITFKQPGGLVHVLVDGDIQPFTSQICSIRSLEPGETWCLAFAYDPAKLNGKRPVATDVFAFPAYARVNDTDAESIALHCANHDTHGGNEPPTLDVHITNDTNELVDPEFTVVVRLV